MAYHHPFHGNDAALFAHLYDSQSAHALPLHVHLGLHHAHRPYGHRPLHRFGALHQCASASPAVLHHPLCTGLRPHQHRDGKTYDQTVMGMQYQGKSVTEAQNMAAMSAKGKVQVQATLVSIKEMAGWTFYGCLVCAGLMLVIPWRKRNIKELTAVSAEEC